MTLAYQTDWPYHTLCISVHYQFEIERDYVCRCRSKGGSEKEILGSEVVPCLPGEGGLSLGHCKVPASSINLLLVYWF